MRRRGFTLIELLVVIAIIAVLIALLLIASTSVEPITVTVFPRVALTHIFEVIGYEDLADTIDRPASDGKMTLLLLKDDDYQCVERHAPPGHDTPRVVEPAPYRRPGIISDRAMRQSAA
jgi:prepilin-type N-terminal cleavage/methylation domain-containing protein